MTLVADRIAQLRAAIAAQDQLRPVLGDETVDAAISALQSQIDLLIGQDAPVTVRSAVTTEEEALDALQARVPAELADKARRTSDATPRAGIERRTVTVMIADLSGFTALGERFDPELIREFQDDLFDEIASVVYAHEGFVEKFVGDAVVSVFGAPLTHEDDPERAMRAALAIRERMEGISERWGDRLGRQMLELHIGIDTGPVVAGQIGPERAGAYSVTGDTVNTASRLQDAAKPGQILVSQRTQRLAQEAFDFRRLKPIKVQGKQDAVTVFELERARLFPGQGRGLHGLNAGLVGRQRELAQLKRVAERLTAGQGQVVLVTGEAGIGKSRLMTEWHRSLGKGIRFLEGRSYAGATGVPYGPFADLSRRYAGIKDEDTEARARSRLRQGLNRVLPGGMEAMALVASMLGMRLEDDEAAHLAGLTPQATKERLFALVEDLIRRLARQRATVLVLEDLHWADASSLELVQHLLPLVREVPLAMVGVFRRGEGGVDLLPLATDQYAELLTPIELLPLERESAVSLVEELLAGGEGLPANVRDLIVGKAEGNPFFVEEVIRTLIERGGLERSLDGAGWVVTPKIEGVAVPDTLQGVLAARLDRLEPDTRKTAQEAAVIGRIFQERVLARLADDVARLESQLEHLEREELIRELRRDPDLEYIFKHALTQEVAYETLSAAQRRELHSRVGVALEELVADRIGEFQAILGAHFLRGEIWDKAYSYYLVAGDAAARLHAYPEALLHYAKAEEALGNLPPTDDIRRQTVDLTVKQMVVSWGAEDPGRNLAKLAEAEAIARALPAADGGPGPDRVRLARVQYWIGRIHYYRDEPREAIGYFQQVLAVGQELRDEGLLAIPLAVMGRALVVQGHFDRAIPVLAGAIDPLEKAGEILDRAFSIAYHGVAVTATGNPAVGLMETQQAVALAQATKSPTIQAGCYIVQTFQSYLTRDLESFLDGSRLAVETGRTAGNSLMISVSLGYEGWALGMLGRFEEAEQRVAESSAEAEKIGGRLVAADWIAAGSAEAALTAGKPDEAVARAQTAIEKARAIGGIFGEGVAQRTWGLALYRLEKPLYEQGDEHLTAAIEQFGAGDCKTEIAHTNFAWGEALRDRGEPVRATERFELATEGFRAAGLNHAADKAEAQLRAVQEAVRA